MEEREKVLEDNELFCRFCLRFLRNANTNSCGPGRHTKGTGYNGMCAVTDCEKHVTICKRHEPENRNRHRIYKDSLEFQFQFQLEFQATKRTNFSINDNGR